MSQDIKSPLTGNGSGADSQNQAGKWYKVRYVSGDLYAPLIRFVHEEFVFIPSGQSIAKHVLKHVKERSIKGFPFSRNRDPRGVYAINCEFVRKGIIGAVVCLVKDITLLTSDGQMISGIKPRSIVNLFDGYVKPVRLPAEE